MDKQPVWHLSFETCSMGRTDLKTRRTNYRLLWMYKILNELVEISINDRLIPADKRTHQQAIFRI